ncbi:hypothetical protein OAK66_05840 [Candidatus Nitrosopelagicus sp.]|jgi:hypothetical protein|nr:hypothetical protein [Candidatus Nitrosopelagicus sp.]
MGKMFPIIIIVVAIIGFSSSAYFFSQMNITIESPISMEIQNNRSLMQEIESCIEQNLAGESSIALNSFNTNMLLTLKEAAMETENEIELEQIKQKLYTLTNCKP